MGSSLLSLSLTTSTTTPTTATTTSTTMTRIFEKRARRSPLLVGTMHKNWDVIGKQKMIRMSIRKLKKLGDPETGKLCKAVLINNTLESVKNSSLLHSCHVQPSHYSSDEERILSNVRLQPAVDNLKSVDKEEFCLSSPVISNLPDPIGPLSDDEDSGSGSPLQEISHSSDATLYTNNSSSCDSSEYLLQDERTIFNSYLSLCSSSDLFECKSLVAA